MTLVLQAEMQTLASTVSDQALQVAQMREEAAQQMSKAQQIADDGSRAMEAAARRGQLPAQRNDGQSAYAPTRRTRLLDRHNDFTHFAQFFCKRWSRYHYRISNSIGNIELRRSFRNLL